MISPPAKPRPRARGGGLQSTTSALVRVASLCGADQWPDDTWRCPCCAARHRQQSQNPGDL